MLSGFQIQLSWIFWRFELIHSKPLNHCLYVAFLVDWIFLPLVRILDPETSVLSFYHPCGMMPRAPSWHQRSLSCFLMLLWCRQPRPRRRSDPLSKSQKFSNIRFLPLFWNPSPHNVLFICRFDHWDPISLCRPIFPALRPCLCVVTLVSKSRCLGKPWPHPSLCGATGPNCHLVWLRRLFCVPHSHPQS